MTCEALTDAIVDLARGVEVESASAARVHAHLSECGACATRFQREHMLTAGLRELSRRTADQGPSDSLRRRLLEQFAESQPVMPVATAPSPRRLPGWVGVAAVLVAGMSALVLWRGGNPIPTGGVSTTTSEAQPTQATPTAAAQPSAPPVPPVVASEVPNVGATPARSTRRPVTDQSARTVGFVPLPGAAALPVFESGQIVRMELPVTALPLYGVEIPPDARHNPVHADFLVGQDGQPRAIRLVRSGNTGTVHP
jgi:hypothetical protein